MKIGKRPMRNPLSVLSLAVLPLLLLLPSSGSAGGVDVFVGINLPFPGVIVGPAPVVVSPPPVVVVEPAPVVVRPRPVVVHSRPVVVHSPPVVVSRPVVIKEHRKVVRYKPCPPGKARKYDKKWARKGHY